MKCPSIVSLYVYAGAEHKPVNKQRLEILELEMRARAIKKMLQSQQGDADLDGAYSVYVCFILEKIFLEFETERFSRPCADICR